MENTKMFYEILNSLTDVMLVKLYDECSYFEPREGYSSDIKLLQNIRERLNKVSWNEIEDCDMPNIIYKEMAKRFYKYNITK